MKAVDTFARSISSAGIRDRFLRLNLFAGSNLNAALVPLYRSSAFGGTPLGNATDTNNAFVGVGTDYAETGASGGLTGNGSTKFLNTGLNHNYPPTNGDRHLSVYKQTTASGTKYLIGTFAAAAPTTSYRLQASGGNIGVLSGGANNLATFADANAMWHGNGTTANVLYKNGVQVATNTNGSDTVNASAIPFFVFSINGDGSASSFASERLGAYSIGLSMTAPQAAAYYTAMQAFQTALGRNV
jgi:hypothetical protein